MKIIPPHFGEYGVEILDHVRYVESLSVQKIVCCEKEKCCLYPSAAEYFTDYSNPIPDSNRVNHGAYMHSASYMEQITAIYQRIVDRYPGIEFLEPTYGHRVNFTLPDRLPMMQVKPRLTARHELPPVHIVLAPRWRQLAREKNWPMWSALVGQLQLMGLRIGVAGSADTVYPLTVDQYGWKHSGGPTEGAIDLLQHCRLFVGTDTGPSHLAAMMDIPMVVFGKWDATNPDLTPLMKAASKNEVRVIRDGWDNLHAVVQAIEACIHGAVAV